MKIFGWLADEEACGRYRIMYPFDAMKAAGYDVRYSVRGDHGGPLEWADVVVGQRISLPGPTNLWHRLADEGRARLVYEIDDDVINLDPRHNRFWRYWKDPDVRRNVIRNIRVADLVTVTTEPLAELLRQWNPNVKVLPNCVPQELLERTIPQYRLTDVPTHPLVIGWGGSPTHAQDWLAARDGVAAVLADNERARMRFLGTAYADGLPPDRVEHVPWTKVLDQHFRRVSRFHVGLAPLVDTTFNRSKSDIKVKEYMALGIPPVASDLPAYNGTVRHGQTGFLARTPDDFAKHIATLLADVDLRIDLGGQARLFMTDWTYTARAQDWADTYASLL